MFAPFMLALTLALTLGGSNIAFAHVATRLSATQQEAPSRGETPPPHASSNGNIIVTLALCQDSGCQKQCVSNCQGQVDVNNHFLLQWESGPLLAAGFTVYWGDGSEDPYRCIANCNNGTHDFYHFYSTAQTDTITITSNVAYTSNTIVMNIVGHVPTVPGTPGVVDPAPIPAAPCVDTTDPSTNGRRSLPIMDGNTMVGRVDERYSQGCGTWWARAYAFNGNIVSLWIQPYNNGNVITDPKQHIDDAPGGPAGELITSQTKLKLTSNPPGQYLIVAVEQVNGQNLPPQTLQPA